MCLLTPVSSFTSLITASQISSPCKYDKNESKEHIISFIIWWIIMLIYTSLTAPVGIFHTPVPPNLPLVSWTTSTYQTKRDCLKYNITEWLMRKRNERGRRLPLFCYWRQKHQRRDGVKHLQECYQGYEGSNIQASSNLTQHDGT